MKLEYLTKGLDFIPDNYKWSDIEEKTTYEKYLTEDVLIDVPVAFDEELSSLLSSAKNKEEFYTIVYDNYLKKQPFYSEKDLILLKLKDAYLDLARWDSAVTYTNRLEYVISENRKAANKNLIIFQVFLTFSLFFWIFSFLLNIFYIGLSLNYHPFLANFLLILALFLYLPRLWSKKKAAEALSRQENKLTDEAIGYFNIFRDNVLSNTFLNSLADDFSNPSAIIALHNYIFMGRADNMKEAMNLFIQEQREEQLNRQNQQHQQNMEAMARQNTTVNTINMINNIFKK